MPRLRGKEGEGKGATRGGARRESQCTWKPGERGGKKKEEYLAACKNCFLPGSRGREKGGGGGKKKKKKERKEAYLPLESPRRPGGRGGKKEKKKRGRKLLPFLFRGEKKEGGGGEGKKGVFFLLGSETAIPGQKEKRKGGKANGGHRSFSNGKKKKIRKRGGGT